jgi:hypothetical protein
VRLKPFVFVSLADNGIRGERAETGESSVLLATVSWQMQLRNGYVPMEASRTALDAVKTKSRLLHDRKPNSAQFNRAARRSCTVKALVGRSRVSAGYK